MKYDLSGEPAFTINVLDPIAHECLSQVYGAAHAETAQRIGRAVQKVYATPLEAEWRAKA